VDAGRKLRQPRAMPIELPASLGVGKLLRLQGMVTAAASTEAARDSAAALVHAYNGLQDELRASLESDETMDLAEEFDRLFPPLAEPGEFSPVLAVESHARLAAAAEEGRTRLVQMGGWIQGLIEEITLQERMRLEAEAKAREQAKPRTGFG
jgi:hypothetical protein